MRNVRSRNLDPRLPRSTTGLVRPLRRARIRRRSIAVFGVCEAGELKDVCVFTRKTHHSSAVSSNKKGDMVLDGVHPEVVEPDRFELTRMIDGAIVD